VARAVVVVVVRVHYYTVVVAAGTLDSWPVLLSS